MKVKKMKKRKVKNGEKKTVAVDTLTGEIEEDEDCSAKCCVKPSGMNSAQPVC